MYGFMAMLLVAELTGQNIKNHLFSLSPQDGYGLSKVLECDLKSS
jgi:hypothetical protein